MNRRVPRLLAFALATSVVPLLNGCAADIIAAVGLTLLAVPVPVGGEIQVTVAGPPTADCVLSNELGQWTVQAPGKVRIGQGSDLTLSCRQAGYEPATALVSTGRRGYYPEAVHIALVPLCAADDADCLARRAEAQQRAAEEAAAAEAARAAARETPGNLDVGAAEQQTALAAEQGKFDAWYARHSTDLQNQLHKYLLQEGRIDGGPSVGTKILETTVSGSRAGGFVVDISWRQASHRHGGNDNSGDDSFFLRVENDELVEIERLGPAT